MTGIMTLSSDEEEVAEEEDDDSSSVGNVSTLKFSITNGLRNIIMLTR